MMRFSSKPSWLTAGVVVATVVTALAISGGASAATPKEINLASPSEGLAFCKSGAMKAGDAYITGGPGLVQEPPTSCTQAVVKKIKVSQALEAKGKKVKECTLVSPTTALSFCNSGSMGTYNIDYIRGYAGHTISGPGYGCTIGYSTSSIGTALCK